MRAFASQHSQQLEQESLYVEDTSGQHTIPSTQIVILALDLHSSWCRVGTDTEPWETLSLKLREECLFY